VVATVYLSAQLLLPRNEGLIDQFPIQCDAGEGLGPKLSETLDPFAGTHVPFFYINDILNLLR
jgi:hypothetical protein